MKLEAQTKATSSGGFAVPDSALDLRLFRYAIIAAEYGSFRRAAAAMNVQQSSVSRGVRSFEQRLGAELFERGHTGIRPTLAGDHFLQEASLGFDHLIRAMRRVGALQRGEHVELTVAVSVPFALVGHLLERFRSECHSVVAEIVEGTCSANCAHVMQGKVDIAFVTQATEDGSIRSLHLRDERLMVALPKAHQFAGARAVMLEELRGDRLILSDGGFGPEVADYIARCAAKSGTEANVQRHQVGECDLINMVARGFGVTIVVGETKASTREDVVLIPLAGRHVLSLYAAWRKTNPNPALKVLLKILEASSVERRRTETCGTT